VEEGTETKEATFQGRGKQTFNHLRGKKLPTPDGDTIKREKACRLGSNEHEGHYRQLPAGRDTVRPNTARHDYLKRLPESVLRSTPLGMGRKTLATLVGRSSTGGEEHTFLVNLARSPRLLDQDSIHSRRITEGKECLQYRQGKI